MHNHGTQFPHCFLLAALAMSLTACSAGDSPTTGTTTTPTPSQAAVGTTVEVSVTATDSDNDQLHYRWAATEGVITNVDAPTTTWVVPQGSGIQFAYVLVSDKKGGYTERRAAVLTQGQPTDPGTAPALTPPAPANTGYVWGSVFYQHSATGRHVYLPNVAIQLYNTATPSQKVTHLETRTNMKGEFFISGLPNNTATYFVEYTIDGRTTRFPNATTATPVTVATSDTTSSSTTRPTSPSSVNFFKGQITFTGTLAVVGHVRLADRSFCGVRNEFFTDLAPTNPNALTEAVSASVQLLTSANGPLSNTFPVNHYGDYLIVRSAIPAQQVKVRATCEQLNAKDSGLFSTASPVAGEITLDNSRPTVQSMAVLLNGQDVGRPDLPSPHTLLASGSTPPTFNDTNLEAEIIHTPGDDTFLTYKGLDTRKSACAYYRAIGAVDNCVNGYPSGQQLTLDQWKKKFYLSPFGDPSVSEVKLIYINKSDLNFARDMQAVRLADGSVAYNVCNYAGPQSTTGLGEPIPIGTELNGGPSIQPNIDLAIENVRRGIGMVACVAMDYSADSRFTKFYSFGPTGKLLLSVSLDGRREKFMPGSCTACHGGDFYGGQFPEDGSGSPDIGSRWQPFDMENLVFSSTQDMAVARTYIKQLNQMLVGPNVPLDITPITTKRTKDLVAGWYANGDTQVSTFVAPGSLAPVAGFYQNITQPSCQTCHAAQLKNEFSSPDHVCGGSSDLKINRSMTNALVPFERFWLNTNVQNDDSIMLNQFGCKTKPKIHPGF